MEESLAHFQTKLAIAQYETQFKTKNEQIVWEKEVYNWSPDMFKFEVYKSQIAVSEKGMYEVEFALIGLTAE